jgi:outer membrane receptor protein involved in Fe transport
MLQQKPQQRLAFVHQLRVKHQIAETLAQRLAGIARQILQLGELGVEESEQVEEGVLVAAVGRGGEQDQVALRGLGQPTEQTVALVPGTGGRPPACRCGPRRR